MRKSTCLSGLAALAALVLAGGAAADDRDLLWSRGADPNVLMVVDSSGSMTNDVATDCVSYVGGPDDPHAKLAQVKMAVRWFVNSHPAFNLGFSFFQRDVAVFGEKLFVYQLTDERGLDFSWRWWITEGGSRIDRGSQRHEDIPLGAIMRMGDETPLAGGRYISTFVGPFFGPLGKDSVADWYRDDDRRKVWFNGVQYTGEYRVDAWLVEPNAGTGYYYPAYDWNSAVQDALVAFQAVHVVKSPVIFDPLALPTVKLAALDDLRTGRQALQAVLDANQIGRRTLTVRVQLRQCQGYRADISDTYGTCSGTWAVIDTFDREITSAGGVSPAAVSPSDTTPGTYSGSTIVHEYSGCNYAGQNSDYDAINTCNGWEGATPDDTKIPLVPIPTDEDPDTTPLIAGLLGTTGEMQMFFPTRSPGDPYWPKRWEDRPQCNNSVAADDDCGVWVTDRAMYPFGSTPLKNSLNDSQQYFEQDVMDRDDPLKFCRKNFVILLTDGLESCSNQTTLCGAATDLGRRQIPVFVIGYGLGTSGNALDCIADNSGGQLYLPNNLEQLMEALRRIGQEIEERSRGFASPSVPSVELSTREKGYISTFLPLNGRTIWEGRLRAYVVEPTTGTIPTTCQEVDGVRLCYPDTTKALWDAAEVLAGRAHTARNMYYGTNASPAPGTRTAFTVTSTTKIALWNRIFEETRATITSDEEARLTTIVNFMRGDRDSTEYRFPNDPASSAVGVGKLGDIFHSMPLLLGRPDCFPCYNQGAFSYRSDFYDVHFKRRKVLFVGADDGALHAFDAGFFDRDTTNFPDLYDDGTGKELFAWMPNAVMPVFDELAEGENHYYTVDGTATTSDVYIKRTAASSTREWRSVLLVGQRQGGDSMLCLDITTPDPYSTDGTPQPADTSNYMPGCLDSTSSACSGMTYPAFRWEFSDTLDSDGNGFPDMANSWSRPAVAWVKVHTGDPDAAEIRNVAIFGGGFEPYLLGGNFVYMIDIETGKVLLKLRAGGSVPGEVAILDYNQDGTMEVAYFGDGAGNLWRLDVNQPALVDTTTGAVTCSYSGTTASCSGWTMTKLLDTSAHAPQPFFHRPVVVLAGFDSVGTPLVGVGLGAGNRENIFEENSPNHRFYFVLDDRSGGTVTQAQLQQLTLASSSTTASYLISNTTKGWALELGVEEKVNTPAIVLGGYVFFSTFTPGDGVIVVEDPDNPGQYLCRQTGNARTYVVDYQSANPYPGATSRYQQLPPEIQMASELIAYVGEDGKLHVLQAADLAMFEPRAAEALGGSIVSWREREP